MTDEFGEKLRHEIIEQGEEVFLLIGQWWTW